MAAFACDALNKDILVDCFLQVGHSLASYGFKLHGLLSDGLAANRGLQAELARQYGDERT